MAIYSQSPYNHNKLFDWYESSQRSTDRGHSNNWYLCLSLQYFAFIIPQYGTHINDIHSSYYRNNQSFLAHQVILQATMRSIYNIFVIFVIHTIIYLLQSIFVSVNRSTFLLISHIRSFHLILIFDFSWFHVLIYRDHFSFSQAVSPFAGGLTN